MIRWNAAPAVLIAVLISVPAFAQGGGASSTGTIQGRVADAQGAVVVTGGERRERVGGEVAQPQVATAERRRQRIR